MCLALPARLPAVATLPRVPRSHAPCCRRPAPRQLRGGDGRCAGGRQAPDRAVPRPHQVRLAGLLDRIARKSRSKPWVVWLGGWVGSSAKSGAGQEGREFPSHSPERGSQEGRGEQIGGAGDSGSAGQPQRMSRRHRLRRVRTMLAPIPPGRYSMLRMGIAPCSPFSVTNDCMIGGGFQLLFFLDIRLQQCGQRALAPTARPHARGRGHPPPPLVALRRCRRPGVVHMLHASSTSADLPAPHHTAAQLARQYEHVRLHTHLAENVQVGRSCSRGCGCGAGGLRAGGYLMRRGVLERSLLTQQSGSRSSSSSSSSMHGRQGQPGRAGLPRPAQPAATFAAFRQHAAKRPVTLKPLTWIDLDSRASTSQLCFSLHAYSMPAGH